MTLDHAQDSFAKKPSKKTAGDYLATLIEYMDDDMIGDDTFFGGLCEVRDWLKSGVRPAAQRAGYF